MRFWDSSALVPLLVEEPASDRLERILREDPLVVAWWASPVECWSALSRRRREGGLTLAQEEDARRALEMLASSWAEVLPSDELRETAGRLLRVHALRAADSLQLAAALTWAGPSREGELVVLDERLGEAARLEGLGVVDIA